MGLVGSSRVLYKRPAGLWLRTFLPLFNSINTPGLGPSTAAREAQWIELIAWLAFAQDDGILKRPLDKLRNSGLFEGSLIDSFFAPRLRSRNIL
jgi:hypothetical protein